MQFLRYVVDSYTVLLLINFPPIFIFKHNKQLKGSFPTILSISYIPLFGIILMINPQVSELLKLQTTKRALSC